MDVGGTGSRGGRLAALQSALGRNGADLLALAVSDSMRYAFGGYAPHADERFCALLLSTAGRVLVIPTLNADQARGRLDLPLQTYQDEEGPGTALTAALTQLRLPPAPVIAVDEEMRADHLLVLQDTLPEATYRLAGAIVGPLRRVKDTEELAALRRAAATADAGVEAVFAACKPGVSELELAAIAGNAMVSAGAEETVFAMVGAGSHGALPHHQPDGTRLRAGDTVVIDIGSRLGGYCSDITRMAIVGPQPADSEYRRVHAVVEEAWQAAWAAARPGARASEVDGAARAVIAAAGYGDLFVHRTGHGLGLSIHEAPYITATNDLVLEAGMVFSIEPGIYLPDRFGVRLEEIVYLDAEGAHVLSQLPRAARNG